MTTSLSLINSGEGLGHLPFVDPELRDSVSDFLADADNHNIKIYNQNKIKVVFYNVAGLNKGLIGYCNRLMNTVYIDQGTWHSCQLQPGSDQGLIDHELGHCMLGRVHTEALGHSDDRTVPVSLMYPQILSEDLYTMGRQYYRNEIFNPNTFNQLPITFDTLIGLEK